MAQVKGNVMTIAGPVKAEDLGVTLPHEHLACNFEGIFCTALDAPKGDMPDSPFSIENLWWIRQNPYHHKSNVDFRDAITQDAIMHDLKFYKQSGGNTIIDCCTPGAMRDTTFFKKAAVESGLNIIAGAGFYIASTQTESRLNLTIEEISAVIKTELFQGFGGTDMKCGMIGEIGTSWPIHAFEKRVLQAVGELQEELGTPVNIHPGREHCAPDEALRLLLEAGGKADRTIMSHLERTIMDDAKLAEFASSGCYCEFDLFGIEVSHYQLNPKVDMPSDAQRIDRLKRLVEQGFEDKIVISHDIHTKHRLMKFGGHGFSHILLSVVPQMKVKGVSQDVIDKFIIHNPRNWLTGN